MITVALEHCGVDPSFAIGGHVSDLGGNSRSGQDPLFVVEADESNGAFLHTDPEIAIVTNVEPDHMFHWGDFENLQAAFDEFADLVGPNGGFALICVDDPGSRALAERDRRSRVLTYGTDPHADYLMEGVSSADGIYSFHVRHGGTRTGPITLQVPGYHMALNATAAFAACVELGYAAEDVAKGLSEYSGTRRRFELVGEVDRVRVFDDYAHHPTELDATLRTARQCVDSGTLRVVFQPYRFHRTAMFTQEFADALSLADDVIVMDVLAAGDPPIPGITGKTIADLMSLPAEQVTFEPSRSRVVEIAAERSRPGDIVMTMGCGDVTELAPQIVAALKNLKSR
jgi:UDP-N-acetylmuramate--alanine ligase